MSPSHIELFRRGLDGTPLLDGTPVNDTAAHRPAVAAESSLLGQALDRAVEAGRDKFPAIAVELDRFLTLLGRCAREVLGNDASGPGPGDAELARIVSELAVEDLYLACAAGHGDATAIELLTATFIRPSVAALCHADDRPTFADELISVLQQKLLVAGESATPKILSFSGRAPLAAWITVVVQRTLSTLRRTEGTREHFEKRAAIEAAMLERDPELGYIKNHYADDFARAFEQALVRLSARERSLLRLHNLHGVTLEKLANIYSVNDATISRWLKQARHALMEETGRHLRENAGISSSEFPSLARALTSQVDISLNRWLLSAVTPVPR